MDVSEIDDISDSFIEAWTEFFGQEMYYIRFLRDSNTPHNVYNDSRKKIYDEDNKVLFHGSLKEKPTAEELGMGGLKALPSGVITFVTKELRDAGITELSTNDCIEATPYAQPTIRFNIVSDQGKVQLTDQKIFTKLGVKEMSVREYG